jgi:hypothetical protein
VKAIGVEGMSKSRVCELAEDLDAKLEGGAARGAADRQLNRRNTADVVVLIHHSARLGPELRVTSLRSQTARHGSLIAVE